MGKQTSPPSFAMCEEMTPRNTQQQSTKLSLVFKPALLGIGLPFSVFLLLTQNDSPVHEFLGKIHYGVLTRSILAGLALTCVLILVLHRFVGSRGAENNNTALRRSRSQFVAACGVVVACALIAVLASFELLQEPLFVVLGLCVGGCFVPLLLGWAVLYARELPESSLFHAALSLILTALLYSAALLPLLNSFPLVYASVLTLVGGSIALYQLLAPASATADADAVAAVTPQAPIPFKEIARMLWKPLLSGGISAFIIGLVWDPSVAEVSSQFELASVLFSDLLAPCIAACVVIAAFFIRPRRFSLHVYNDVVMPVAIAILLVVPLVSFDGIDVSVLTGLLSQICFALVAIAVWTSFAAGVRTLGERPWVIFTLGFVFFALCMLVGMYGIHFIGLNGQVLCLILLTMFLVLMAIEIALRESPQGASRERMKEALEHFLQRRCDELAEKYGLSAREREVFLYLARGYGQVYIAKELYVSENTIRTHVRHIYAKLGINSREELLQLIDSGE